MALGFALVGAGCTASSQPEVDSLTETLAETAAVVNGQVADLYDLLDMPFEDRSQLYARILDLRLPNTLAIELDKTQRVTPPPGAEAELERYVDFLGELLLASEDLDAAIASEDPVGTALAAVSIEVSSGALAVALPTGSCEVLVPAITDDLCGRLGREGYERHLDREIRRFVAQFRPAFRIPGAFGDVVRARALGSLQDDGTLVLQNTATRLGALEPGPAYQRLHAILLDYFPTAAEVWARFEANPTGADPLLYGFITDGLEAERAATRRLLELEYDIVQAAHADSEVVEILTIWFDPPATDPDA